MDESALKRQLQQCSEGPFRRTDFSIGHRGAPLQFPEHTKESYEAAARELAERYRKHFLPPASLVEKAERGELLK